MKDGEDYVSVMKGKSEGARENNVTSWQDIQPEHEEDAKRQFKGYFEDSQVAELCG